MEDDEINVENDSISDSIVLIKEGTRNETQMLSSLNVVFHVVPKVETSTTVQLATKIGYYLNCKMCCSNIKTSYQLLKFNCK